MYNHVSSRADIEDAICTLVHISCDHCGRVLAQSCSVDVYPIFRYRYGDHSEDGF